MSDVISTVKVKKIPERKKQSRYFHIVIPNLQQYKDSTPEQCLVLKYAVLQRLKIKESPRGLEHYRIALEHHANGIPHLDILMMFKSSIGRRPSSFKYLLRHGNINTYRNVNSAILGYGTKEDKQSLSDIPKDISRILEVQKLLDNPYRYLELEMLNDPFRFSLEDFTYQNEMAQHIKNWGGIRTKLKDMQVAAANSHLRHKLGFKLIDRPLIVDRLSPEQLSVYDSWKGYQVIVDHLNQISIFGYRRPCKTPNLLITGRPSCGKSALVWQSYQFQGFNPLNSYSAIYPMGLKDWFPQYQSEVYGCIYWNQAKLTSYAYETILQLLDGSPVMLPAKGTSHKKIDNPLVIMTSNMTLFQMIHHKFGYNKSYQMMAESNLNTRITNVVVPDNLNLFLLQKLFVFSLAA